MMSSCNSNRMPKQEAVKTHQCQTQRSQSLPVGWTIDTKATWPSPVREPLNSRNDAGSRPISRQDIIIAVMGPTGAGKSSFINVATRQSHTAVGHDLESCTQEVRAVSCAHRDGSGRNVVLVDTPGFNDSNMSDSDILERIAHWMTTTYKERIILTGLLFFHRISDNRLPGTPLRNLSMFEKLCGPGALQNVILTTTMWDEVDEETGSMREEELRTKYWKSMITFGSRIARVGGTYDSAWDVIDKFANTTQRPVLLQQEMVDQGKDLANTAAGSALFQFWEKLIANFREILRKLETRLRGISKENDPEAAAAVKKEKLTASRELEQAKKQKRKVDPEKRTINGTVRKALVRRSSFSSKRGSRSASLSPMHSSSLRNYADDNGIAIEERGRTLAGIISVLQHVQSIGSIAPIPFLSGAVGLVLTLAQSVQAARINENSLLTLTRDASRLILCATEQVQDGGVSENMKEMVENLVGQLSIVQKLVNDMASRGLMARYIFQAADEQVVSACQNSIRLAHDCFELKTSISAHQALARIEARLLAMSMSKSTPNLPDSLTQS